MRRDKQARPLISKGRCLYPEGVTLWQLAPVTAGPDG